MNCDPVVRLTFAWLCHLAYSASSYPTTLPLPPSVPFSLRHFLWLNPELISFQSSDSTCYMIPDSCNILDEDPPNQTPPANVSTQSPAATKTVLPGSSSVVSKSYSMKPPSDIPPRPSTAPPHPSSANKGKETDRQTRTMLVSNLRARNLLLQKAISHIDDAVLHLMAARSGIPNSKIQQVRGEARSRKDLLDRVDRAIKMAQNGELHEDSPGGDTSREARSGAGERYATSSSFGERKTMLN